MKALIVCEYRDGKLLDSSYELAAFADRLGADKAMVLVGNESEMPRINGTLYLADAARYGNTIPTCTRGSSLKPSRGQIRFNHFHAFLVWLGPRAACSRGPEGRTDSEITNITQGTYEVGFCNAKLRRPLCPGPRRGS